MYIGNVLPLVIVFLFGYTAKRIGILERSNSRTIGKLLIYFVVPAVVIKTFSLLALKSEFIYLPLSSLIVVSLLALVGYFFATLLGLRGGKKGAFVTSFPTLECGSIGYAYMFSVFGEQGLSKIVMFDVANTIFLFTIVYFISCHFGDGGFRMVPSIYKFLKSPLVWAIFIGLLINITGLKCVLVSNLLNIFGDSLLFLIMLMLGLLFEFKHQKGKCFYDLDRLSLEQPLTEILLKTGTGLTLGFFVTTVLGLTGIDKIAVIVGSSLPPSIITLIFAEENKLDIEYTADLLSQSLLFSLVFLTLLINVLR
jgi:predicted permease